MRAGRNAPLSDQKKMIKREYENEGEKYVPDTRVCLRAHTASARGERAAFGFRFALGYP